MRAIRAVMRFANQHPTISAFTIVLVVMLYLNLAHTQFTFYWDADAYWSIKDTFVSNGAFSLLNYNNPVRSYLFPLILLLTSRAAQVVGVPDRIGLEICMSLFYTAFLTVWTPTLIQELYWKRPSLYSTLVFSALVSIFWRGLLFYPLSDLLSLVFVVLGALLMLKSPRSPVSALLAGIFWGGAILVRPIYLVGLPFLLLWALYHDFIETGAARLLGIARSATILAGLVLVTIPQTIINFAHFRTLSPLVQTQRFYGSDLFTWQLGLGIIVQKYETNVGGNYPKPGVAFWDPAGRNLLLKAGYDLESYQDHPPTLGEYFRLVQNYPLDFLAIYARHVFNGLDVVYNTVYVADIYDSDISLRLLNYSVWFLVLVYLAHALSRPPATRPSVSQWLIPLILVLPAVASIPTAMEVRFMLPAHVLAYALLAFSVLPEFANKDLHTKTSIVLKHLVWYFLFVTLCLTLSTNTYAGLAYGIYVLR